MYPHRNMNSSMASGKSQHVSSQVAYKPNPAAIPEIMDLGTGNRQARSETFAREFVNPPRVSIDSAHSCFVKAFCTSLILAGETRISSKGFADPQICKESQTNGGARQKGQQRQQRRSRYSIRCSQQPGVESGEGENLTCNSLEIGARSESGAQKNGYGMLDSSNGVPKQAEPSFSTVSEDVSELKRKDESNFLAKMFRDVAGASSSIMSSPMFPFSSGGDGSSPNSKMVEKLLQTSSKASPADLNKPAEPVDKYSLDSVPTSSVLMHYVNELSPRLGYLDAENRERVFCALKVAEIAHAGQKRKSGEPYIIHPIAVTAILADMQMDRDTLIAGLLHDTVEDTDMTLDQLESLFGRDVRRIVEGETKLGKLASNVHQVSDRQSANKTEEDFDKQAEYLRNMFLAMTEDVRVIIVKLADRLHNMRTLEYMSEAKQKKISKETLDIFAPMAHRLGMARIKNELEDLSFNYLYPDEARQLKAEADAFKQRLNIDMLMEDSCHMLSEQLHDDIVLRPLVKNFRIQSKTKSLYSIYRKLKAGEKLNSIFDLLIVKIVIELYPDSELAMSPEERFAYEKNSCYHILGRVHSIWKPVPGRVKDYIAFPKPNGYQCLHTAVFFGEDADYGMFPVEVQISTVDMQRVAEEGIAAELFSSDSGAPSNSSPRQSSRGDWKLRTMLWLRSIREYCDEFSSESSRDLVDAVRLDLLGNRVFVFTPKGLIIDLPKDSTPVDLAFKVHSDVGYRMIGVKVNGRFVLFDYKLQNADLVKIVTSASAPGPNLEWLKWATTRTARQKIRKFLRARNRTTCAKHGYLRIMDVAQRLGVTVPSNDMLARYLPRISSVMQGSGFPAIASLEDLFVEIDSNAHNEKSESEGLERMILGILDDRGYFAPVSISSTTANTNATFVRLASCCMPVRGDPIVGIRPHSDAIIDAHRVPCSHVLKILRDRPDQCVGLEWSDRQPDINSGKRDTASLYRVRIFISARDCDGLLSYLAGVITGMGKSIVRSASSTDARRIASLSFEIMVEDSYELGKVIERLLVCEEVMEVERIGVASKRNLFDESMPVPQVVASDYIRVVSELNLRNDVVDGENEQRRK